ncbi:hypothetical protein HY485_04805 [Candidatus Woesearchaeota archaeon]|nr:hypothetical protein [Candidatus Woesearchaeota archaeon]
MTLPELEKLAIEEQPEFVKLFSIPPHELTAEQEQQLRYFGSKISFEQYAFELKRYGAKTLQKLCCTIIQKNPFILRTAFGELELPDCLVPKELKQPVGVDYHADILFADVAANLDTGTITQFSFKDYLKKASSEELAKIPTLNSLSIADWPKIQ